MYYAMVGFYVLVCLLLLIVVLLQQGKGGDIAAAFGGSSSQTAFGARAGATVLTRATTVLGALFMVCAFVLGMMGSGTGGGSVMGGIDAPPVESKPNVPELPLTLPQAAPAPGLPATAPTTTPPDAGKGKGDAPKSEPGKKGK